uniref:5', 3'-nucleotidase, cytosolic n=1 Tax=Eptatretus burgeri TaxID=7764 RepID=A0A8C4NEJ4_EPTBU
MARALRVLVDMDMVLADLESAFLEKFRARYPDEPYIPLEKRRGFLISQQYSNLRADLADKAESIWESKNFFLDLQPIPGAVDSIKQMDSLKNTDVFICSSPPRKYHNCVGEKFAWVEKHLGKTFVDRIILTRDKTVVSADLLIDDNPFVTGAEPSPSWEHVLFTACHNQHMEPLPSTLRLNSWFHDWRSILQSKRSLN